MLRSLKLLFPLAFETDGNRVEEKGGKMELALFFLTWNNLPIAIFSRSDANNLSSVS